MRISALCPLRLVVAAWVLSLPAAALGGDQAAPSTMLLLDAASSGRHVVVVGERGAIFRSEDSGENWSPAHSPTHAALTGVALAPDGVTGWAVGHDALILRTADAGKTWTQVYQGDNLESLFLDVCALDASRVIAVGGYGLYAESHDGGLHWTARKINAEELHLNRITRGPAGTLYIAGERGTLLRSSDHGDTWQSIHSPYDGSFYGILPLDASTLLAYGLRGNIYFSTNNGSDWKLIPNEQHTLIATGLRLRSGVIILAGQSRGIFLSRDAGHTFTHWADAPLATAIAELIETADGRLLAVGERGVSFLPAP